MNILSDKIVTNRKKHNCNMCNRLFERGFKMRVQVNTYDGIGACRMCLTCSDLIDKFGNYFDNGYNEYEQGCVEAALNHNQSPENLLIELKNGKD